MKLAVAFLLVVGTLTVLADAPVRRKPASDDRPAQEGVKTMSRLIGCRGPGKAKAVDLETCVKKLLSSKVQGKDLKLIVESLTYLTTDSEVFYCDDVPRTGRTSLKLGEQLKLCFSSTYRGAAGEPGRVSFDIEGGETLISSLRL